MGEPVYEGIPQPGHLQGKRVDLSYQLGQTVPMTVFLIQIMEKPLIVSVDVIIRSLLRRWDLKKKLKQSVNPMQT